MPTGYLMPTVVLAAPYLRRFRMGRKYLEVLTAKMMLGMRKKVHHPRQNQKAFWTGAMRSAHQAGQQCLPTSPVPRGSALTPHAWPHALLLPLSTGLCSHDGLGTLTQGSAIMSHRIT